MTAQLDKALSALRQEFADEVSSGLITSLGTYNCRRKNNTANGAWSEHAWPNAVDVMLKRIPGTTTPTAEAKAVGYKVSTWMKAHPELWSEVFWQVMAHYDHVHGTATPRRNYDNEQIPPCAGGTDPGEEMEVKELVMNIQRAINATGVTPPLTVDGEWGVKTHNRFVSAMMVGTGTPGPQGPAGPKGDKGAKGDKGDPGPSPKNASFTY